MLHRLSDWSSMSAADRTRLADEVAALAREVHDTGVTMAFLQKMAGEYPAQAGCLPAAIGTVVVLAVVLRLGFAGGMAFLVVFLGLLLGLVFYHFAARRGTSAWIESTMRPAMVAEGIDEPLVEKLLAKSAEHGEAPAKLHDFAKNLEGRLGR